MRRTSFLNLFLNINRVTFALSDIFICFISLCVAVLLFDFISPWIGKSTIDVKVMVFFKENAIKILGLYALLNYIVSILKIAFNRSRNFGWFSLLITTLLYIVLMSFWIQSHDYSLKTFSLFAFFILWGSAIVLRKLVFNKLDKFVRNIAWNDLLAPIILRYSARAGAYFKEKPSFIFIIIFMFLLIVCGFLLSIDKKMIAEKIGNWAYFSLCVGVFIELIQSFICRQKNR